MKRLHVDIFPTRKNTVIIYAIFIIALLPVICLRDFTPANELRYLSIADEALENHNFFAFTNHGLAYADKPPLYLWGIMICRVLAGGHYMWLLSFLSIIPAIIITRIFDKWTANLIPDYARIPGQLMLLTTGLFLVSALTLRMDIMMCMFIVLSLFEFWKINKSEQDKKYHQWIFALYIFLAVFTKGPLGFLIPFIGTVVWILISHNYKLFAKTWGWRCWVCLIICCTLWFGAVYFEGGSTYLNNLLFHQTMDRAVKSFHHAAPFYYYFICSWYCLIPWTLAILGLIIMALRNKRKCSGLQSFFIVIACTTIIMLSCISSKIQIYMLPAIPFIVYGSFISFPNYQNNKIVKLGIAVIASVFCLVFPVFLIVNMKFQDPMINSLSFYFTAALMTIGGYFTLVALYKKDIDNSLVSSITVLSFCMLSIVFTAGFAMKTLNPSIGFKALADSIENKHKLDPNIKEVRTFLIKRPENMDVFLDIPVVEITDENYEPTQENINYPYIFATRVKNADCIKGMEIDTIGKYCVTVIYPEN